jgi:cysteine synthase A
MAIVTHSFQLIGNTPMLKLNSILSENSADVFVKLEFLNPGGSVKDRIALNMIETAEKEGKINPKDTILIEPTSGNTGIGISLVASSKGYRAIMVMPDSMTPERRKLIKVYGSEIILTPGIEGMKGAINKAEELVNSNENYYMLKQFDNPANPEAHIKTTALEILRDMNNDIDAFVAGVGTGGTFTGVSTVLKENVKDIKLYAVEPFESSVLSGEKPGGHKIQGIGAGFIPSIMNTDLIDSIVRISSEEAYKTLRLIAKNEGIFLGPSSSAAITAAIQIAENLGKGKRVVVIAPDNGERYLSILDI